VSIDGEPEHTEERCTAYEEGKEILGRIDADSTGFSSMVVDWTAGFTLEAKDATTTVVTAQSRFKPKGFVVCLMLPLVKWKFHQTQQTILGGLKQFVESR